MSPFYRFSFRFAPSFPCFSLRFLFSFSCFYYHYYFIHFIFMSTGAWCCSPWNYVGA